MRAADGPGSTVPDLVADWPDRQRAAVVAANGSLSYAELCERADTLAASLRRQGVAAGSLVALSLPRSAEFVVACLAVWRAGAAYLALDPAQPAKRLRNLVRDSRAGVVVTESGTGSGLELTATDAEPLPAPLDPGVAYVLYTSGSTGAPKGVMVEHAGLANLVAWHASAFSVTQGTRCSQIASPGFDASVWEIWGCLPAGGTLHVVPETARTDPHRLRDWLCDSGIEVAFVPTPLAELMIRLDWPNPAALRAMLTGGDRLRHAPAPGLPFRLVNNYGVTEATVVTTSIEITASAAVEAPDRAPSIGRPIPNVICRVLDRDRHPVPDGDEGELAVGGVSVARGYLHRPDLTVERFFEAPDPETGAPVRWYLTGDAVRRRPDGTIDYLRRVDDQVQLLGHRVEPAEIEAVLDRHPAVRRSVVAVIGEAAPRLVAYLEAADGASEDGLGDVRQTAVAMLPAAMVPTSFEWIDAVPLTANGKVDRAALRRRASESTTKAQSGHTDGDTVVAARDTNGPDDELVAAIADTVADLLGVERIGPDDDFLLLGGHSLLGAQLVTRLSERFGVELSLRSVFLAPTPVGMAGEIRRLVVEQVAALDDDVARMLLAQADTD